MSNFFVNIGGFIIAIDFERNKDLEIRIDHVSRRRIEMELFIYLRDFIVLNVPKKVDFTILFKSEPNPPIIRQNNTGYTPLVEYSSTKKVTTYSQISIYQFESILKRIIFNLLEKSGGFAVHSSSAIVKNNAYLFLGPSGSGKSTIARLLSSTYQIISDDMTLIREVKKDYYAFQTPFFEKNWWIQKTAGLYKIGKIFFIYKANKFSIEKLTNQADGSKLFLDQAKIAQPLEGKTVKDVLGFSHRFKRYNNLYFAKDEKGLIKLIKSSK